MLIIAKPTLKEIINPSQHEVSSKYIQDYKDLKSMVNLLRDGGYKIALTQGVYDWFHVGHLRYLIKARSFADVLVVGVDSDELTRQMKGPERPFDDFEDRIEILSALHVVNIVARRDVGQHMYDLIRLVRPDVLIMSQTTSSFSEKDKNALSKYCGAIEHLEAQAPPETKSTTAKMRKMKVSGAKDLASRIQGKVKQFAQELISEITDYVEVGGSENGK